jgi:pyruvate,water dikinase
LSNATSHLGAHTERLDPSEAESWIVPLGQPSVSLETVGSKAVNLARLATKGFPVPCGFFVATDAYRAFVTSNALSEPIEAVLEGLATDNLATMEAASQAIRRRFRSGVMPADLEAALCQAYETLGSLPVAVRSSATAEDLPDLSFAGQQDTFLNVLGQGALLEAVIDCWSSLWTARAIAYRSRNGIPHVDLAIGIVVQEMIPAEASGVLFTANPVDGRRTEMVVEAALGLGEALVSGQVEPDRYRIDAASGRILERTLGAKDLSIRARPGGGTVTLREQAAASQALPETAIADLVQLGRQVAGLFGSPQDVEWAWASGQIYLLQSRPITTLFPVPVGMGPEPLHVLWSYAALQGVMEPITPLGRAGIRAIQVGSGAVFGYPPAETYKAMYTAGERLWFDITSLFQNRIGRRAVRALVNAFEPSTQRSLKRLQRDERLAATSGLSPRFLWRILPASVPMLCRLLWTLLRPETERVRFERDIETRMSEIEADLSKRVTLSERAALVKDLIAGAYAYLLPRFIPRFWAGMLAQSLLFYLAKEVPRGEEDALVATRGLPHNVTTQMGLALWETAQTIRRDPDSLARFQGAQPETLADECLAGSLPEQAHAALADFLARYGMRGMVEIDLGRPRWHENPVPVLQAIQSYLRIEDPKKAPDAVFTQGAAAAQAAIDRLSKHVRETRGGRFKAWGVRWAARRMRALVGLRETPKFWGIRVRGLIREALLDSGRALADDGLLEQSDDLFFLRLAELKALEAGEECDWSGLVAERRRVYAREMRRTQIPRLLLSDGRAFYEEPAAEADGVTDGSDEAILVGSPVSPGVVQGPVRVVFDPHTTPLVPGEILVCPGTDPSWTPLLLIAGGLVMEVGGLMTHGSVVAREYGIPAVVGVSQATKRLQTGQGVRVDGTSGRVIVLEW